MAVSETPVMADRTAAGPAQADLDRCVHCGLCLNACPTYRELGVEMDSPRGRIYQMNQVAAGAPMTPSYIEHLDLCLACRGCETACPSGVPYGRMIEAARAEIRRKQKSTWVGRTARNFVFKRLLPSRAALQAAGAAMYAYQASGIQRLLRASGVLKLLGHIGNIEALSPTAEIPFFYSKIGKTFPAIGAQRYRVAFLSGCIANVAFARLNEATVHVLQQNGCEVVIPAAQNCCGALHLHSGREDEAQALARRNIDAVLLEKVDAVITNAAGCGSTLKEYDHLLRDDPQYAERAVEFKRLMRDVTEFLASIELNRELGRIDAVATYQDSCHLAHGQQIRTAPRSLLKAVPGLTFREMRMADGCCGSAGIYNVVHNELAMQILEHKMENVNATGASIVVTANPGCMLQLEAGARLYGSGQRVMHVVEVLDESYRNFARS
ncbi:MAG TPA: heterodisulfide reductase-related iron-sulfur binding cluster [Bryobacteraceae bacterium]|jgi:glycolate oxidase iron-sulfur subunit